MRRTYVRVCSHVEEVVASLRQRVEARARAQREDSASTSSADVSEQQLQELTEKVNEKREQVKELKRLQYVLSLILVS